MSTTPAILYPNSIKRNSNSKFGETVSILDFGPAGSGLTDDSPIFAKALQSLQLRGSGVALYLPGGYTYLLNTPVLIPAHQPSMTIYGDGDASVVLVGPGLPVGMGAFDVQGAVDISFENFLIDGQKLVSDRLKYGRDFIGANGDDDPMANVLTTGTSIWVHANSKRIKLNRVTIQHTQGYAVLFDARFGPIVDVTLVDSWFLNNRPSVFGDHSGTVSATGTELIWQSGDKFDPSWLGAALTISGNLCTVASVTDDEHLTLTSASGVPATSGAHVYDNFNYGSWNGGVHLQGDGLVNPYAVRHLMMRNCNFRRCTGNGVWSHSYGALQSHYGFTVTGCTSDDQGLDFILLQIVTGGLIAGNYGHRIGYVCSDDTSPSQPRWLNGRFASGLDSGYQVLGVTYSGNTFLNTNGDAINLDGFAEGSVIGNMVRIALPGETAYIEDQVGALGWGGGPAGGPNYAQGIISSNTYNQLPGGDHITIVGNTIENFGGGAILLYAGRGCLINGNNILHPSNANVIPMILGNIGPGSGQRSYNNSVVNNRFEWNPLTPMPCIQEVQTAGALFQPGDTNYVGPQVVISSTAYAFKSAVNSLTALGATVQGTSSAAQSLIALATGGVALNGVVPDLQSYNDGSIGTMEQFSSVLANFTPADVGKAILIKHAGFDTMGYITAYISPTTIQTPASAASGSGLTFWYGTDYTPVIQAAIDSDLVGDLVIPTGAYWVFRLRLKGNMTLRGQGRAPAIIGPGQGPGTQLFSPLSLSPGYGGGDAVLFSGGSGVGNLQHSAVLDIAIIGMGNMATSSCIGVDLNGIWYTEFRRVLIQNFPKGFNAQGPNGTYDNEIAMCKITQVGYGIYLSGSGGQQTAECTIHSNRIEAHSICAIYLDTSLAEGNDVFRNDIAGFDGNDVCGIDCEGDNNTIGPTNWVESLTTASGQNWIGIKARGGGNLFLNNKYSMVAGASGGVVTQLDYQKNGINTFIEQSTGGVPLISFAGGFSAFVMWIIGIVANASARFVSLVNAVGNQAWDVGVGIFGWYLAQLDSNYNTVNTPLTVDQYGLVRMNRSLMVGEPGVVSAISHINTANVSVGANAITAVSTGLSVTIFTTASGLAGGLISGMPVYLESLYFYNAGIYTSIPNGVYTVTVLGTHQFSIALNSSAYGTYAGGGVVYSDIVQLALFANDTGVAYVGTVTPHSLVLRTNGDDVFTLDYMGNLYAANFASYTGYPLVVAPSGTGGQILPVATAPIADGTHSLTGGGTITTVNGIVIAVT